MKVEIIDHTDMVRSAKERGVLQALEEIGQVAEGYAKAKCPVDTGRLRASIDHAVAGNDTAIIAAVQDYAAYVEFGTSKMAAQPYLKPAAMGHSSEYKAIVEECLRGA